MSGDGESSARPEARLIPLRIDPVRVGANGGAIGMIQCPGRAEIDLFAPIREADLVHHVQTIADWGASALVSLIEREEFDWYGVESLPELAAGHGLRHLHLPIADMGVPDARFELAWQRDGAALRTMLLSGRRIVVHCLAGLGRTGTIAARLLVELGAEPREAIGAVRRVRPGTIQTVGQERHVLNCRRIALNAG